LQSENDISLQVALLAATFSGDVEIKSLSPPSRNCYFEDEIETLKIHKKYTHMNCILECSLNYAKEALKMTNHLSEYCTPWYFPSQEDQITICDPWKTVTFMKFFTSVPADHCRHCLPGTLFLHPCAFYLVESFLVILKSVHNQLQVAIMLSMSHQFQHCHSSFAT
jgi:hypothetical protein